MSVRGGDELSRLADEFNELTGRLQTTEEVRRRFVSDASHELKTPLASIRLLTDSLLQADHMDGETAREFLNDIGDEADRLTRITEKLLTLTRLDTAPAAEDVPVDVGAVVERVEHMLSPLARAVEAEEYDQEALAAYRKKYIETGDRNNTEAVAAFLLDQIPGRLRREREPAEV